MNPLEFIKEQMRAPLRPTHRVVSAGSPHGMLTLAPKNAPVRDVPANRKNRRYAAKINREIATERRIAARRKKEKADAP